VAFSPEFLDELRSRIGMVDLVGRRVRLTRKGEEYAGFCPFHHDIASSFYVVEDQGVFHCFGCGAHGDAVTYIMRAENLGFIDSIKRLAGEAGLAVPQSDPQDLGR
jgi:DNA primase